MTPSSPPKKSPLGAFMAGIAMLLVMLTTGCQQNATATAKNMVTPTPVSAAATPIPTISPERLAVAKQLIITLGCVGCHTIDTIPEAIGVIGPNLTHIYTRASNTITSTGYKGKAISAREYLKESLLAPSTFVALECPSGPCPDFVMPRDFKTRIKADDLEILLDLLSTLK